MQKATKRIVIAAGGTGGHIFPGIAIADAVKKIIKDVEILFVSGAKPIEREIYSQYGINPIEISVFPTKKGISGKLKAVIDYYKASKAMSDIFKRNKPDLVVGMGGYVSAPVLRAVCKLDIPFVIHEQNSIPGKVNRYYAKKAHKIFCSFKKSMEFLSAEKTVLTGIPIRDRFFKKTDKKICRKFFKLDENGFVIFIQGGSQGAKYFNQKLLDLLFDLDKRLAAKAILQVLWSSGRQNYEELEKAAKNKNFKQTDIKIVPFISEMENALGSADLVLSRAGAGSVSEILIAERASVLIPLPTAADNHQYYNAEEIVESGAAVMILEDEIATDKFINTILAFFNHPERLEMLSKNASKIALKNAADIIAENIVGII